MTLERCGDSMRSAAAFFSRHFPERPCAAIACWSWIFNTQFEETLSPDSNLVRYQRELYLYPLRSNGKAGLLFMFGEDDVDPTAAPRDTSTQRAMLDKTAQTTAGMN